MMKKWFWNIHSSIIEWMFQAEICTYINKLLQACVSSQRCLYFNLLMTSFVICDAATILNVCKQGYQNSLMKIRPWVSVQMCSVFSCGREAEACRPPQDTPGHAQFLSIEKETLVLIKLFLSWAERERETKREVSLVFSFRATQIQVTILLDL